MTNNDLESTANANRIINLALRLCALAVLVVWCFRIVEPFINLIVWGIVLSVTLYPLHQMLTRKLKNRSTLAACIIVVMMLLILIAPAVWLLFSTVDEVKDVAHAYRAGTLHVPPPNETVKGWPLIGNKLFTLWTQASTDITKLVTENQESLKPVAVKMIGLIASTGKGLIILAGSMIVSGVLLSFADSSSRTTKLFFTRLAGNGGEHMASMAEITIRNVAKGILGVAVIQSTLAGIGFVVVGLPAAGVWVILCLILGIVQIGILPVSIGSIIYIWGAADNLTAILFTVWMILVGVSDNILKPIMLGKGAPVPMMVVFIGAIGGFMLSGFIGLFTGAIIFSLGYKLFREWVEGPSGSTHEQLPQS